MIKLIISDFDGTLVDTFEANLRAYQQAFNEVNLSLSTEEYRRCFGFRFERFMSEMGITDEKTKKRIRDNKKNYYPNYFNYLKINTSLVELISTFHAKDGKTAIASTARRENLENALQHTKLHSLFDLILAGEEVTHGKPSPEIYEIVMKKMGILPKETLIFEDSEVGLQAAKDSGAHFIKICI